MEVPLEVLLEHHNAFIRADIEEMKADSIYRGRVFLPTHGQELSLMRGRCRRERENDEEDNTTLPRVCASDV